MGYKNVHFDHDYLSISTVEIPKILTTSSHISLEEDSTELHF